MERKLLDMRGMRWPSLWMLASIALADALLAPPRI
jgi:hypothetical protein